MATMPHPDKTWRQYGVTFHHYTERQMIDYGLVCASEARAESIEIRKELARYQEREKTMGWNQS
jgi:hypothetical protein